MGIESYLSAELEQIYKEEASKIIDGFYGKMSKSFEPFSGYFGRQQEKFNCFMNYWMTSLTEMPVQKGYIWKSRKCI